MHQCFFLPKAASPLAPKPSPAPSFGSPGSRNTSVTGDKISFLFPAPNVGEIITQHLRNPPLVDKR